MGTIRTSIRKKVVSRIGGARSAVLFLLLMAAFSPGAPGVPAAAAMSSSNQTAPKAYVGLFRDNAVAVLDTATNMVVKTIPVPPGPHGLVVTPDGRKVYVSSEGASTVSVIDAVTDSVVNSIDVGATPHGLAITPDGRQILVSAFGTNRAVIIDATRDQIVGQVPVPQPHNSAITPDGRTAYVASQEQGATALVILNLETRTRVGVVPLDKTPRALNFSPDGKWLYVTVAGDDAVQVLDPASNRITTRIPVGASPHHPLFTPNDQFGLVVSQGPGELDILDPVTNTLSGTVEVGKAPHWIAVSSDSRTAYVTNEVSNTVSVINLAERKVTATIPVGNAPRKIAVQPGSAIVTVGGRTFSDHGTAVATERVKLNVEVDDYYFAPTFLRGKPGQKLMLEVQNGSGTLHNFSIPELQLDKNIPPKSNVMVEVTFPQAGALHFFCKFHTAIGMNGALLVGNATP
jgi:YVTN family beta-propeller protein